MPYDTGWGQFINQLTNPPNPFDKMGGTIDFANKLKQFQADKAVADAYQQSIGPDGSFDQGRFNTIVAGGPGAWRMGATMQQAGQGYGAEGLATQAQTDATRGQLALLNGYLTPLIQSAGNGEDISADQVRSVIQNAPGLTPQTIAGVNQKLAGLAPGQVPGALRGFGFAAQSAEGQAARTSPTIGQNLELAQTLWTPRDYPDPADPTQTKHGTVGSYLIDTGGDPNGTIRRMMSGGYAPGAGGPSVGASRGGAVGGGKGGASGPQSSAGGIGAGQLYGFLTENGATKNEATMLTSAANSESSFRPDISHDGGIGYGLFGHNAERLAAMRQFAGVGPNDPVPWQKQALFALSELHGSESGAGAMVNSATTPEQLTDAQLAFERPNLNIAGGNRAQRFASTSEYWNKPPAVQVASARPTTATDAQPANPYAGTGGQGTYVPPGGSVPRNIATGQPAPAGGVVPQPPGPGEPTNINQPTPPVSGPQGPIGPSGPVLTPGGGAQVQAPPVQLASSFPIGGGYSTPSDLPKIVETSRNAFNVARSNYDTFWNRITNLTQAADILRNNPTLTTGTGSEDVQRLENIAQTVLGQKLSPQATTNLAAITELNKDLERYYQGIPGADRSDLGQTEAKLANPTIQMQREALSDLIAKTIGMERLSATVYQAFVAQNGGDPARAESNAAHFAAAMAGYRNRFDPVGFGADFMNKEQLNEYMNGLRTGNGQPDKARQDKFWNSILEGEKQYGFKVQP